MGDDSDCIELENHSASKDGKGVKTDLSIGAPVINVAESSGELVWSPGIDWRKDVPEQYQADAVALSVRTQKIGNVAKRWLKFTGAMLLGSVAALFVWFMIDPGGSFSDVEIPTELAAALAKFDFESAKNPLSLPFKTATAAINEMAQGPLVKMLALAMFVIGTGSAVAKQSVVPAITGVMGAIFLSYGPSIISNMTEAPLDNTKTAEVFVRKALENKNYKEAVELIDKYAPLSDQTSYLLAQVAYQTKDKDKLRAALDEVNSQPPIIKSKPEDPVKEGRKKSEAKAVETWKPPMSRLYEMETMAFGSPKSTDVITYAESRIKAKSFFGSTSATLFGFALINLLLSGGMFGLWLRLKKRIETIGSLAKKLNQAELPPHKGILE